MFVCYICGCEQQHLNDLHIKLKELTNYTAKDIWLSDSKMF